MVSKKMQKALNQQLNREYFSSYLYLSMSAYCSNAGLNGSANWFYQQYQEEVMHGMKIYDYIAMREKDHATYNFLQWFVTEQVEEEASVSDIIAKIELIGKDGKGLYIIDNELAKRVAPNPTEQTE